MGSRRSAWQIGRTHWSSDVCSSDLDMDRFLDAQLKRLNTSRIDYYLVHSLNGGSWDGIAALGVAEFLDRAQADGRIANAGFSYHGLREDFPPGETADHS